MNKKLRNKRLPKASLVPEWFQELYHTIHTSYGLGYRGIGALIAYRAYLMGRKEQQNSKGK